MIGLGSDKNNFCQNEPANRLLFGNMEAMDSMLQQLAYYKRHDPAVAEEVIFNSYSLITLTFCLRWS